MLAAKNGRLELVHLLIDADADMDLPDPDGNTARKLAAQGTHSDISDYLRSVGAVE